jgi:hypothetical protein
MRAAICSARIPARNDAVNVHDCFFSARSHFVSPALVALDPLVKGSGDGASEFANGRADAAGGFAARSLVVGFGR